MMDDCAISFCKYFKRWVIENYPDPENPSAYARGAGVEVASKFKLNPSVVSNMIRQDEPFRCPASEAKRREIAKEIGIPYDVMVGVTKDEGWVSLNRFSCEIQARRCIETLYEIEKHAPERLSDIQKHLEVEVEISKRKDAPTKGTGTHGPK